MNITDKNIIAEDMTSSIVEIELDKLKIHPKNIRESYEGIEELAVSIKRNGILQNLTVVPDGNEPGTYFVVVGNRRLLAAKAARLKTAPCRISHMGTSDQAVTMLTENMNRENLKLYEEAAGTQMCLSDFGLTVVELSEMTGLTTSKIQHRVNAAKLDQKAVKAKADDTDFQLSFSDLEKLEKISSMATRNKILREAKDPRDLAWKAQAASDDEKRQKVIKKLESLAKKQGIEPAPEGTDMEMYGNKWDTVKEYPLSDDVPDKFDVGDTKGIYYLIYYRTFKLIKKAKKKEKKPLTEKEVAKKELSKARRQAKELYKEMHEQMREFVCGMITGKIKGTKDKVPLMQASWEVLVLLGAFVSSGSIAGTLTGKSLYELPESERTEALSKAGSLSLHHQMIAAACSACKSLELMDYNGHYSQKNADALKKLYLCIAGYGFTFSDAQYDRFMNGTHEIYVEVNK